jgi:phosphoglucomutase
MMDDRRKSDTAVVPGKSGNADASRADATEGRAVAKGNSPERNVLRTQSRTSTPSALERVRQVAQRDRKQRFTALLHHVYDVARLQTAYLALKRDAAAGVDARRGSRTDRRWRRISKTCRTG